MSTFRCEIFFFLCRPRAKKKRPGFGEPGLLGTDADRSLGARRPAGIRVETIGAQEKRACSKAHLPMHAQRRKGRNHLSLHLLSLVRQGQHDLSPSQAIQYVATIAMRVKVFLKIFFLHTKNLQCKREGVLTPQPIVPRPRWRLPQKL